MSLSVKENKDLIELGELPMKLYYDKEKDAVVFDIQTNIIFKVGGNVLNITDGKKIDISKELHLNPTSLNRIKGCDKLLCGIDDE